jgi:acetyl esterase/lipase
MYSGLALLMDVHYPVSANGIGLIFIPGSGWRAPFTLDARPLKENTEGEVYATPLVAAGYTVFTINHRASPRFQYPAAVKDAQRAVRFIRYNTADFGIEPHRIGALGGSSGGYLATLLGVLDDGDNTIGDSPINQVSAKVKAVVARE